MASSLAIVFSLGTNVDLLETHSSNCMEMFDTMRYAVYDDLTR